MVYLFTSTLFPALAALNYTYDANGNATTDGTNCYEYNDANQLKKVKLCSNNQTIAEYIYDYNGNRIEKKLYTGGNLLKTVYSPNDTYEATKLASNGATTNVSYYFVNDELAAKKNSDGSKNYFLNDHLGSIGYLTNSAGTVLETTQYYPYGLVRAGGTLNKFLYTGQENDPETGLDYYNFRYYSPQLGRFIQPDDQLQTPYDPQSLNNYSYVKNNPIKYTDPTGHYLETALDIGFLAFDLNELRKDPGNLWDWAALGGNVAGTALPVVTGVGLGIRVVEHSKNVARIASKVTTTATTVNKIAGKITGYTRHGIDQAVGRDGGRGVALSAIRDAVKNPIRVVYKIDRLGRESWSYIGRKGTVVLNKFGQVVSTWGKPRVKK